ncbi:unnamed protein product [Ceutorhynchus assimilis]|uniref:Uncharacterized protein n=1 Tax=Ceutorhynchus assimilis TaxID=467358 RepID=A0A9N9QEW2_9CUCU|nr:unnamed protein product [Ceutorhynchus assimilis]
MSKDTNKRLAITEETLASLQNPSSTSSVKIRKSSNIFSNLVRKARRKKTSNKNPGDSVRNVHLSSQNLSESSTMSLAAHIEEEVELSCQNYENNKKSLHQARDILWESKGVDSETNTSNHSGISLKKTSALHKASNCESKMVISQEVLSSFISFGKPLLDVTNADALQYLQIVITNFHESENHVINLLAKYITDPTIQAEMKNAISHHTKFQWEAEKRSCSLAHDIWTQQLEIGRAQEKVFQDTMQTLVKQNRQLQIENESLFRKYEKACKQMRGGPEDLETDSLFRRNEKLQIKLDSFFKKLESLESELSIFQKQNDCLEQELRNSNTKIQNTKTLVHKLKTEYEIEEVSLNAKLASKDRVLEELLEIRDVVMDELEDLKKSLGVLPFGSSWSKFKMQGSSIADIFQICRASITELSKELINAHAENVTKEKDIMSLQEMNKNLIEESNSLSQKIKDNSNTINEKFLLEQKYQVLEIELRTTKESLGKVEAENLKLRETISDHGKYLKEKERRLERTKLFVTNITTENYTLQKEVVMLNRIIKESGAGDASKDIAHKHEELERVDYSELKNQTEATKHENLVVIHDQQIAYKTLQRQVKELEKVTTNNQELRVKIDSQNETVITLQNERMKYLEEKSLLKSTIQHLKCELSKIKQLEDSLSNVSREASKLGFVVECTKQQSEKLKQEILDKNTTIAHLKTNMEKLNEIQVENAKERVTLCQEINEVSHLKERLGQVLSTEKKKFAELGHSKEVMVKSINSHVQQIEEKLKNERATMKMLLTNMKLVKQEKEEVVKEKLNLQAEIEKLKTKVTEQEEKYSKITKEIANKNDETKDLRREIDGYEKSNKESNEKLKIETSKNDTNMRQLKLLIDRQEIEESKNSLNEQTQMAKELMKGKEQHTEEKYQLITEKNCLLKEAECLNTLMGKVVSDFETNLKSSKEKEIMLKDELDEAKELIRNYSQEIKDMEQKIKLKEQRIEQLEDVRKLEEVKDNRYKRLKEEMDQLEIEHKEVQDAKANLENQLFDIHDEYKKLTLHVDRLEKEAELFDSELKSIVKQKEDDYSFYKNHIADHSRTRQELEEQNQKEITKLRLQLQEATTRLANEKSAYDILSQVHKDVSGKFMRSINDLVGSKHMNQDVIEKLKEEQVDIEDIKNDKKQFSIAVKELSEQLERVYEENGMLRAQYKEALEKCLSLEAQMKQREPGNLQGKENSATQDMKEQAFQTVAEELRKELEENHVTVHHLKMEIAELQKQEMLLQLGRSELTLKLHETEKMLETERSLAEKLKNTQTNLLSAIMQLRDEGKLESSVCIYLLHMMDFLSSSQLTMYESIIAQIQIEHEKSQKLKQEIEKANSNLIISSLSKLKLPQKLGHVNVKIFSDVMELFNLYSEDITDSFQDLMRHKNVKFYMVEVFITNSLQKHLKYMNWSLLISIKHRNETFSKTIPVKHFKIPIIEVVPVDQKIIDCQVSVSIISHTKDNLTCVLLDKVNVDISYHFEMLRKFKHKMSKERQIVEISKCYNSSNFKNKYKPLLVEYKFLTKIDHREFLNLLIKNCYHNIDIEEFSDLIANDSKNDVTVKLSTGSAKHSVTFKKELKSITLESNVSDMVKLKNYFWKKDTVKVEDEKEMKKRFVEYISKLQKCNDKEELCRFYLCLRDIWTT